MDHGYRFGWGGLLPGEEAIERPTAVEQHHSWAHLLPINYLKSGKPEEAGDVMQGQVTLMQVRSGKLFIVVHKRPSIHLARTRNELHGEFVTKHECRLLALHPGNIM